MIEPPLDSPTREQGKKNSDPCGDESQSREQGKKNSDLYGDDSPTREQGVGCFSFLARASGYHSLLARRAIN